MTDEKKIIKDAIDDIKPDAYMKTRLMAKIEEPKKKSHKNILKPVVSCTLALAVLAGVGTYGMTRDTKSPTSTTAQTSSQKVLSHTFNIVAYAQDENGTVGEKTVLKNDDITTLKDYKIKAYNDIDGSPTVESGSESGFNINADSVKKVTFESENGTFVYFDTLLMEKLIDEGKYYIEIPLSDEENKLYHEKYEQKDREFYEYLKSHKNLSKYFKGKSQNANDYGIYYSDKDDYKNINELLLTPQSCYEQLAKGQEKKLEVQTYRKGDKIENVNYNADGAIDVLLNNPNAKYEDLPSDIITITVEFNDGAQASKRIKASFNSKGELQFQYVK